MACRHSALLGLLSALGALGRRFESCRPDHLKTKLHKLVSQLAFLLDVISYCERVALGVARVMYFVYTFAFYCYCLYCRTRRALFTLLILVSNCNRALKDQRCALFRYSS